MIADSSRTRILKEQDTCIVAMYQTGCFLITKEKEHSNMFTMKNAMDVLQANSVSWCPKTKFTDSVHLV